MSKRKGRIAKYQRRVRALARIEANPSLIETDERVARELWVLRCRIEADRNRGEIWR